MKPKANILWMPGINCHRETAHAFELAGAQAQIVSIFEALRHPPQLTGCDIFSIPGGFSWGDHVRAGWIAAIDLVKRLEEEFRFLVRSVPMIGICNGCQILAATGAMNGEIGRPRVLFDTNASARFEHWSCTRVVMHHTPGSVWTEGLDGAELDLPVAHGEGRLVWENGSEVERQPWQIAATYGTYAGDATYPVSPNGSPIAGISRGHILALMPHPERRREKAHGNDSGLMIFRAGVKAVQ